MFKYMQSYYKDNDITKHEIAVKSYRKGMKYHQCGNFIRAYQCFVIAAKQNILKAQYMLICYYDEGIAEIENDIEAEKWAKEIIKHRSFKGLQSDKQEKIFYILALAYHKEQNDRECFLYTKKAADLGNLSAIYNLGVILLNGYGVQQNAKQAFSCFLKAAEKGHETAILNTASSYFGGDGIEQDVGQAFIWYQKLAKTSQHHYIAKLVLINCYLLHKQSKYYNPTQAIEYFEQIRDYQLEQSRVNISKRENGYEGRDSQYFALWNSLTKIQIALVQKDYNQIIALERQIAVYPESYPSMHLQMTHFLGLAFYYTKDLTRAEHYLSIVDALCKQHPQIFKNIEGITANLGNVYFQQGKLGKALECYLEEHKYNKQDDALLNNIALVYYKQKDYLSAIRYTYRAIDANPSNAILYLHLCTIYIKLSKKSNDIYCLQQAIEAFEKAHEIDKEVNDTEQEKALEQVYRSIYKQLQQAVACITTKAIDVATNSAYTSPKIEQKAKKKFRLAKIKTPIERAISEISRKIWGPDHPGDRDRGVHKVYITGVREDIRIFAYITREVLKSLSNYPRVKEEFKRLLRLGMTVVSNAQGEAGFKRLHDGSWEFKIKGKEIGDHRLKGNMIEGAGYIEKLLVLNKHVTKAH